MKPNLKYIILLFFVFIYQTLLSQIYLNELQGHWIKYKAERKDSSKIIDRLGTQSGFIEHEFSKRKFCISNNPTQTRNCINYSIEDNCIETANSKYRIEKVVKDTLIMVEEYENMNADKLTRLYFLKSKKIRELYPISYEDNISVMNKYYSPKFKSNFENYIYDKIKDIFSLTKFKGYLIIDLKKKKIKTSITESFNSEKKLIEKIKNEINNSFRLWQFSEIHKKMDSIKIYFVGKTLKVRSLKSMRFAFFTQNYNRLDRTAKTLLPDIRLSNEYYNEGILDTKNNKFESAISNFTKSYQHDSIMIDAIYNRAFIYQALGELEKACKDWNYLFKLGQKEAEKNYKQSCE